MNSLKTKFSQAITIATRQGVCVCSRHVQQKEYSSKAVPMDFTVFESSDTNHQLPALIIMHGLFGSKQNWRGICTSFERILKRRIYAVDARNHGDSPHSPVHSYPAMAADVVQFMKDRGLAKAVLMGHSMGGRTMMYTAMKYPNLVDRAIIVDISPLDLPKDFTYMEKILRAMKAIKVATNLSPAEGRKEVRQQIADAIGDVGTVSFIMLNLRKRENGEFYWAPNVNGLLENLGSLAKYPQETQSLPPYQGPMMFLCGTFSNYVDPDSWPLIQKVFPNSEIHWLKTSHLVHLEEPEKTIELAVKFINDLKR